MKIKEWSAFALLGLVWGSSFLWIKIAVQDIGPFTLVAFRLLFGLAGLLVVMRLQKARFPRDRRPYAVLGVGAEEDLDRERRQRRGVDGRGEPVGDVLHRGSVGKR